MKKILNLVLLLLIFALFSTSALAVQSGGSEGHANDMIAVLLDGEGAPPSRGLFTYISSIIIDDQGEDKFLASLPSNSDGKRIPPGKHRVLFHWGFSDSIPFDHDGPLKDYLALFPPQEQEKIKKMIVEEWRSRVQRLTEVVSKALGVSDTVKAKAIAGILYDTHLLGDYKPAEGTNFDLTPLQDIKTLQYDIEKNLHRLFGNNSNFVKDLINKIKSIPKRTKQDPSLYAEAILNILKQEKIGERLFNSGLITKPTAIIVDSLLNYKLIKAAKTAIQMNQYYSAFSEKLPYSLRPGINAALFAGAASALGNTWKVIQGEKEIREAFFDVAETSILSGVSVTISDAVIYKLNPQKYAIVFLVPKTAEALGAALNYGLATFIFEGVQNIYLWGKDEITTKDFYQATSESALKAAGTGLASYCSVLLAGSAGNLVVVGLGIAGYFITNVAIQQYKDYDQSHYLFIEDLRGIVPDAILDRLTPYNVDTSRKKTPFDSAGHIKNSPFEIRRRSGLEPQNKEVFK